VTHRARISGFSFVRNAVSLDYPLEESLRSVLPLVDQLVVTVARAPGERDDGTRAVVEALDDSRVEIIDAEWDHARRQGAYADLTNIALDRCDGDWCLYIQADEALHEADHDPLRARAEELLADHRVEGLLFDYLHFFGDYEHLQTGQGWYQREIRMIRNGIGIRSVRDAQSFRYPDQTRIAVAPAHARIFHYGWARHPERMRAKILEFWSHRMSPDEVEEEFGRTETFDYGPLGRLKRYEGTHPPVMRRRIAEMDWGSLLREEDSPGQVRTQIHKDERLKYRFLSAISRWTGIDLNHTNHGKVLRV
jgi:hypothetical protein